MQTRWKISIALNVVCLLSTIMPKHGIYPLSLPQSSVKSAQKYVVFCPFQTEEGSDQKGVSVRVPRSKDFFFWPFSIFPHLSVIDCLRLRCPSVLYCRASCEQLFWTVFSTLLHLRGTLSVVFTFCFFFAEGTQLESNRRIGSEVE